MDGFLEWLEASELFTISDYLSREHVSFRGWGVQWNENDGRCGICGDPWSDFPRNHEAPLGDQPLLVSLTFYIDF